MSDYPILNGRYLDVGDLQAEWRDGTMLLDVYSMRYIPEIGAVELTYPIPENRPVEAIGKSPLKVGTTAGKSLCIIHFEAVTKFPAAFRCKPGEPLYQQVILRGARIEVPEEVRT